VAEDRGQYMMPGAPKMRTFSKSPPPPPTAGNVQAGPTAEQQLLASIYLHVNWRSITRQLTTPEKELFADAVDAHLTWISATDPSWGEPAEPVDRWWRDA
jgi:hypothetical protein